MVTKNLFGQRYPAGQFVHTLEPWGLYWPSAHSDPMAVLEQAFPAGHGVQATALAAAKVPSGQDLCELELVLGQKLPAIQSVHFVALPTE